MGIRVPPRPPQTPEEWERQIRELENNIYRINIMRVIIVASGAAGAIVLAIAWLIGAYGG